MTVGRYFRLGWNQPLVNTLTGPDSDNLRRIFQSLQNWIDFPLVGLSGTKAAYAAGASTIAWSTELYDDYMLHDANSADIRVPSQCQQYFAIGAFCGAWDSGAAGRRILGWNLNGAATDWAQGNDTSGVSHLTSPFLGVVKRGDLLTATCFHESGSNIGITNMELWLVFFPLGA